MNVSKVNAPELIAHIYTSELYNLSHEKNNESQHINIHKAL